MHPLIEKFTKVLRDDKRPSLSSLGRKVRTNAMALVRAPFVLRSCSTVGPRARAFGRRPHITNLGALHIGADFSLSSAFGVVQLATGRQGNLIIGDGVSVNYGTAISARAEVKIGHRTKIGPYCVISDSELPLPLELAGDEQARSIVIEEDVWLGGRVTVLPGARIGKGAVVSAGSIVAGEIPANAIAAGNPARVLRVTSGPPPSGERIRPPTGDDVEASNADLTRDRTSKPLPSELARDGRAHLA